MASVAAAPIERWTANEVEDWREKFLPSVIVLYEGEPSAGKGQGRRSCRYSSKLPILDRDPFYSRLCGDRKNSVEDLNI